MNGFVQFRTSLFKDSSPGSPAQIRRSGGWIVARIDSRHPIARQPQARQALAMTVGGSNGGSST